MIKRITTATRQNPIKIIGRDENIDVMRCDEKEARNNNNDNNNNNNENMTVAKEMTMGWWWFGGVYKLKLLQIFV